MKKLLALMMILQSCGADNNSASSPAQEEKTKAVETPNSETEAFSSLAVASLSDAPACENKNKYQLIYVKQEGLFYSCNGSWAVIDIKPKDGKDGKDGSAGKDGKDGAALPNNQWYDAVSGKYWLIGGLTSSNATYLSTCSGDYRAATQTETINAAIHGIWSKIQGQTSEKKMWTTTNANVYVNADDGSTGFVGNGTNYLIVCIKI